MNVLAGRSAVVTGGGSGVGLAVARALLADGACVTIAGRDPMKLLRAAGTLAGGDLLLSHMADVTDPEQAEALIAAATKRFDKVDILINNAGANIKARTVRELTPESWRHLLSANLDGAFYCTRAVLPQMLERKGGLIVNINSISGKRANPLGGAAYVAAKFGLAGFGLCLAAEEKDANIRVSSIYPGEIDTPILDNRPKPVTPEQRQLILQPEDVAAAVRFIAALPARAHVPELVIKPTAHAYF
jgi:NAD(P)-dependent dehydrogenase (short-subunit alcohol dehydrogenase family)